MQSLVEFNKRWINTFTNFSERQNVDSLWSLVFLDFYFVFTDFCLFSLTSFQIRQHVRMHYHGWCSMVILMTFSEKFCVQWIRTFQFCLFIFVWVWVQFLCGDHWSLKALQTTGQCVSYYLRVNIILIWMKVFWSFSTLSPNFGVGVYIKKNFQHALIFTHHKY